MPTKWSKETVIAAIRKLNKAGVRLNDRSVRESHVALWGAGHRLFGGWKQAVTAAGLDYQTVRIQRENYKRKWSKKIVIREMRRLRRKGVNLRSARTPRSHSGLAHAARTYCGGWRQAYLAAGVKLPRKKIAKPRPRKRIWDKEKVVRRIQQLHMRGARLNSNHVQNNNHRLYNSSVKYWGGWKQAIEAAGLSYDEVRIRDWLKRDRVWTNKKVLAAIRKRYHMGLPLNSNHIQTKEKRLYGASIKRFGGWPQAIIAAGLDYEKLRKQKKRNWTKQLIAQEIIRRSALGLSIRGGDVCVQDHGLYQAAMRHFGEKGWARARVLAGFSSTDPDARIIWNERTVCEEILLLYKNGVSLNTASMQKSGNAHVYSAGCKVFGNWAKAVKAVGLDYSKIRKMHPHGWWTKSRALKTIKGLEAEGIRLSSKAMQQSGRGLVAAAIILFGSWSQAVEAAGINYREHCLTWSTKAWLRRMDEDEYKKKLET